MGWETSSCIVDHRLRWTTSELSLASTQGSFTLLAYLAFPRIPPVTATSLSSDSDTSGGGRNATLAGSRPARFVTASPTWRLGFLSVASEMFLWQATSVGYAAGKRMTVSRS